MRGALLVLVVTLGLFMLAAPPAAADTFHCYNAVSGGQAVNCAVGCASHIAADLAAGTFGQCLIHP